jgi:Tfp pilus assembly protein PilF
MQLIAARVRAASALVAALSLSLAAEAALAASFTPANDSEVVETLPGRFDPALMQLAARNRELQRPAPGNPDAHPDAILAVVRANIEAARRHADPRYLGRAEQLLQPWNGMVLKSKSSIEVQVLRATIHQSLHHFDQALDELNQVLSLQPSHPQALLTRATILQIRGDYAAVERDCAHLLQSGGAVVAQLCLAGVASVSGRADPAARLLQQTIRTIPESDTTTSVWAHTLLAETLTRTGNLASASNQFDTAMRLDPGDRYLRAAYCDFLLDQRRPDRVLEMTTEFENDDNLLLRRVIAMAALHDSRLDALRELLRQRYELQRQRGDRTHLREEARFRLYLMRDTRAALLLAQQNWQQQHEPADARILHEANIAAGSSGT